MMVVRMPWLCYGWARGDPRRLARMAKLSAKIERLEGMLLGAAPE
jgi:hypothetical protein